MKSKNKKEEQEFKKYLDKIEDPKNEQEINRALPLNADTLQVVKYKLCKKILSYQMKNNLTDKELTQKIDLSLAETEDILFCEIEKFTLDRLLIYASRLLAPNEIEVIIEERPHTANARVA